MKMRENFINKAQKKPPSRNPTVAGNQAGRACSLDISMAGAKRDQ